MPACSLRDQPCFERSACLTSSTAIADQDARYGWFRSRDAGGDDDVCRKHAIFSATFYKWKAKHDGLEVSDAKRLKAFEDENAKLKKLLAEAMQRHAQGRCVKM